MMVYARSKMMIQDNCFVKDPGDVKMKYVGPHVAKIYQRLFEIIKRVFNVPESAIQEENYNWGKGTTEKFKADWIVHKDIDSFSFMYVKISISGEGTDKMGNASIRIKPYLRTEYPQDTLWQKSIFYEFIRTMFHRTFYHNKRDEIMEDCRQLTSMVQKSLQELFKELRETA
jgi:hypothetical protein